MKKVDIIADALFRRIGDLNRIKAELADTDIDLCELSDIKHEVHVYCGIRALADEANTYLEVRTFGKDDVCLYFLHRGIEFFQLQKIEG